MIDHDILAIRRAFEEYDRHERYRAQQMQEFTKQVNERLESLTTSDGDKHADDASKQD